MAEVTRVPLQPIAKGSLWKFWLGMALGALLGFGLAWFTTRPATVSVDEIVAGEGPNPTENDAVFVEYVGKLDDGTEFDRSPPRPADIPPQIAHLIPEGSFMELGGVVPGFREAIMQMQKGGTYEVFIPAKDAYGATPPPGSPIPPNADLTFEVTLHEFMNQEQLMQRGMEINTIMEQVMAEQGETPEAAPAE